MIVFCACGGAQGQRADGVGRGTGSTSSHEPATRVEVAADREGAPEQDNAELLDALFALRARQLARPLSQPAAAWDESRASITTDLAALLPSVRERVHDGLVSEIRRFIDTSDERTRLAQSVDNESAANRLRSASQGLLNRSVDVAIFGVARVSGAPGACAIARLDAHEHLRVEGDIEFALARGEWQSGRFRSILHTFAVLGKLARWASALKHRYGEDAVPLESVSLARLVHLLETDRQWWEVPFDGHASEIQSRVAAYPHVDSPEAAARLSRAIDAYAHFAEEEIVRGMGGRNPTPDAQAPAVTDACWQLASALLAGQGVEAAVENLRAAGGEASLNRQAQALAQVREHCPRP